MQGLSPSNLGVRGLGFIWVQGSLQPTVLIIGVHIQHGIFSIGFRIDNVGLAE